MYVSDVNVSGNVSDNNKTGKLIIKNLFRNREENMNVKKFLTGSVSALLAASMLAGCSAKTSSAAASKKGDDKVTATITVWGPQEDQTGDDSWLAKETAAFAKEHPDWDLTFKFGVCSEGDAKKKVGDDPEAAADVYMYANDQIPDLLKANALAQLGGSTVDDVKKNNSPVTVNTVTYDDGVYGVPFTANTWFMYYDKRVFSDDDVKNLDTMLTKGKVGFPLSNSWYIASFYAGNGCTLFGADGTDAKAGIDFSGDKAVAVTNYLVDLVNNPNFVDANGLTPSTLADGTINALFSGTWDYQNVVDAIGEENVGVCKAPTYTLNGKEVQIKAFAGSKAIGVNPNSKNPEVAVALAAYLGSTQAQQDHYDMRKIVPTDNNITVDDAVSKAQTDTIDNASILQPLQADMANYWTPAESMGKELVAKTVTHDNAAEKTEEMNKSMNTSSVQ